MTKQVQQYRICDRPHPREVPAVVQEKLMLNGVRWDLDLCQACSDQLHALIHDWGDCGTQAKGNISVFDAQRKITGPVTINLDAGKPRPEKVILSSEDVEPEPAQVAAKPRPAIPHTAARWVFSDHAVDRLNERELTSDEVLHAAESPATVFPDKKGEGLEIRQRGEVIAVVDPYVYEIVTAYRPGSEDDWRPATKAVGVK
jgi:hypothetical protein